MPMGKLTAPSSAARLGGRLAIFMVAVLALWLPASTSADGGCTATWTGDAGDGSWQSPGNWSTDAEPGSSDVVCVGAGATVTVTGTAQASVLKVEGALVVASGVLRVGGSEASSVHELTVSGGELTGVGTLDVSGSLSWTAGSMSGSGETVLEAGGVGLIDPGSGNAVSLSERDLVNRGTLTWGSGSVYGSDSAEIDNAGTLDADSQVSASGWESHGLIDSDGSAVWLDNTGVVKKAAGDEYTTIQFQIDNEGSVEVESGDVIFTGGGHGGGAEDGSWLAGAGAALAFNGGSYLLGSGVRMSGLVYLSGGSVQAGDIQGSSAEIMLWANDSTLDLTDAATPSHVKDLTQTAVAGTTTLTGVGTLDVSGSLSWTAGSMSGSGETVLEAGGVGLIDPGSGNAVSLSERDLVNRGTLTWGSGSVYGSDSAEIDNAGTLDADSQVSASGWESHGLIDSDGSAVWLDNTGVVKKAAGDEYTTIQFQIDNEGSVEVESGDVIFTGGGHGGGAEDGSWLAGAGAALAFNGGSYLLGSGVRMSGLVYLSGGSVQAGDIQGSSAEIMLWANDSTLDLTDAATPSHVKDLTQTAVAGTTTLTGVGTLDVSGSLSWTAGAMSGSGKTVLQAGASAVVEALSGCGSMSLEGRELRNEGDLDLTRGTLFFADGARLLNMGSFAEDSESTCQGAQLQAGSSASAPAFLNEGSFQKTAGGGTGTVGVDFDNEGSVQAQTGRLDFAAGGVPERVAAGSWSVLAGATIALTGGTFLIGEEVDLSAVEVSGATVEREPTAGPPVGYLNPLAYASRTVVVSGYGHEVSDGFANAAVEVAPAATSEWRTLCTSLAPNLLGEYSCEWNTASGSYPDGSYRLRAQLADDSSPPSTRATADVDVLVDNTAPSGSVTPRAYIGATATVQGTATDSGSGVASWQLQIAAEGSGEWVDACPDQTAPASGDQYQCSVDAASFPEGPHVLRAVITDEAGNAYTTPTTPTTIDNTQPTGTLASVSESGYARSTIALAGSAGDSVSGVASWTAQIATSGSGAWSDACAPQTSPAAGSTYSCSLDTGAYADGSYEIRALIQSNAGDTHATAAQTVTIDNTPPTGSIDRLAAHPKGTVTIEGPASDTTAGVMSWQLQISAAGTHSWRDACAVQDSPIEGLDFGCAVDTTQFSDGPYQLRAVIVDRAGNTYTTLPVGTDIDNAGGQPEEGEEQACTDVWTGQGANDSWGTAANWSTDSVPASGDRACIPANSTALVSAGGYTVGSVSGEGTLTIAGGSLELREGSAVSELLALSLQGGRLYLEGTLKVLGSMSVGSASGESPALSGPGTLMLAAGASGTVDGAGCALWTLQQVTFVNDGTVTEGAPGGVSGQLALLEGARLDNAGTFNLDSYPAPCVPGGNTGASIESVTGAGTVVNTGSLDVGVGSGKAATLQLALDNQATVVVSTGAFVPMSTITGGVLQTHAGASVQVAGSSPALIGVDASGAEVVVSAGSISVPSGESSVGALLLQGGTLKVDGELDVTSSLSAAGASGESPEVSGSGRLVLAAGASGVVDGAGCALWTLKHVTFVNDGTVTEGAPGGVSGQLMLEEGARLDNTGTFNLDTYKASCVPGGDDYASIAEQRWTAEVVNDGVFSADVGNENAANVGVPFVNDGRVETDTGALGFGGGGGEAVTNGSWRERGGSLELQAGTFRIEEGVDLDATIEGATVVWIPRSLRGSLSAVAPYVAGAVELAGEAEAGIAGPLASATIEVARSGSGTWQTLCGPLSPGLGGAFECPWETATGEYPDGRYELRAKLASGSSPPETLTTTAVQTVVDNTPPTGDVTAPPSHGLGGEVTVTGSASDSGSGVASWQLQIAAEGSSEWAQACPEQIEPVGGDEYACTIDTSKLANGTYQLRAVVRDRAANAFTSSSVSMHVDNEGPHATLTAPAPFLAGTVQLEGTASADTGTVASWDVQIAPAGSSAWSSACPAQDTPAEGSTYRCSIDTASLADGDYELRALASDGEGDTYTATPIEVMIDNTPPSGFVYPIGESVSDGIEVEGNASDAGSGVADWTLQIAPAGSDSYSQACMTQHMALFGAVYACDLASGELENGAYELRAVIVDNAGNSYTTPSTPVTIDNAPPTSTAPPTISGHAVAGHALSAGVGGWSGAARIVYAYQWQLCDAAGEDCTNIEGASASTYRLGEADVGKTVRVQVSASNGAGSASAASVSSAAISPDTLADLTAPAVAGRPEAGATLTAQTGEWAGQPPLSFAYRWQRCNALGEACANIAAADASTYTAGEEDVSRTLRVIVTASNGEGSLGATSAASASVTASAGAGIHYLYESAGRLAAVDDPGSGAALYRWDADGNLLGIERVAQDTLSVVGLEPDHAAAGASVEIIGTGFDADPANDAVSFNGTPASVSGASANDLKASVPDGASAGKVTVTVAGKAVSSPESFTPEESAGEDMAVRMASRVGARPASVGADRARTAPVSSQPALGDPSLHAVALLDAAMSYRPARPAAWDPVAANRRGGNWVSGAERSPWAALPALQARPKATAISGQALTVNGLPLAGVTLSLQGASARTRTDATGRFLLSGLPAGHQVLIIDGASADGHGRRYGRFTTAVEVGEGKTTALGYTIWMTPLDPAGDATVTSPLKRETVITNPRIPGLEVRLPAGTVIRSAGGALVRHLNLTAIPVDRPPFPLPLFATGVPTYFTVQPGRAYLSKGAQIVYPNWGHLPPGQRVEFWNYDPADRGWYVYGKGTVSANGQQVVPDPDVRVWEFTGAMISTEREPPERAPKSGAELTAGDPVDLASGLFVYQHSDLQVPDSVMPVALTRSYRPWDPNSYSFGVGTQSIFDIHLWSDENYKTAYLVLPNGAKVKLVRISPGTLWGEAVYEAQGSPGPWQGATMSYDIPHTDWVLRRRDGMKFIFGDLAPLQAIEDRNGNRITLVRQFGTDGPVVQIRTPHGRSIDLTYDSYGRVIKAVDSARQVVKYEYNSAGQLVAVTDPMGHVTRYAYEAHQNVMTTVTDAKGQVLISNTYNKGGLEAGLVSSQTLAGEGTYSFNYNIPSALSGGCGLVCPPPAQPMTTVTLPGGLTRTVKFGSPGGASAGMPVSEETSWFGALLQSRSFERGVGGDGNVTSIGEVVAVTPANEELLGRRVGLPWERLSRTTSMAYDERGDVTSVSVMAPGAPVLTSTLTYNEFSEPTSVTDPLGRETRYGYDDAGNLMSVTDPMGRTTSYAYDGEGELVSLTDPEGDTSTFAYEDGNQVARIDPLGRVTRVGYDGLGLPVQVTDPEGGVSELSYDADNELTSETDPAGEATSYGYDADGDLVLVRDPRGHTQTGTYTALGQLSSWTDALGRTTSYAYDELGRLASATDALGKTTSYAYDQLGQLASVSFGEVDGGAPSSSIFYAYNLEGNLLSASDSRGGMYSMSYDPYGRLVGESGPDGSVGYGYDADGERTSMSVNGEPFASYGYDEDGELAGIDAADGDVAFGYDGDGRAARVTLPDGDSESYSYDADSLLSGIDYELPDGGQIGDLVYGRDGLGQVTSVSGSLARTQLPEAVSGLSYDAANELTSIGASSLSYDADGRLTGEGSASYSWNDRGELAGVSEGSHSWSFAYDPFGRRAAKTVDGTETSYLYDGANVLSESSGGGTATLLDGPGLDEHLARTSGGVTQSYLTDALGSTVALAGADGAVGTEYTYGPFGGVSTSGASNSNPYGYTGLESEGDGLQFNGARYYMAATGRFASQDPLGMQGSGVNLYQYAGSDPVDLEDPSGYSILGAAAERFVGAVDAFTGGITREIRGGLGLAQPDMSSAAYQVGADAGLLAATITPGDEEAAALDIAEDTADEAALDAAKEAESSPSWIWNTRAEPGTDGGISEFGKERLGDETISTVHQVNLEGEVIHQHQTHIGKYGGERGFPAEWIQFPDVG